jgi:hypothetical protein
MADDALKTARDNLILLRTAAAAAVLGLSPDQFRRLSRRLKLTPAGHYRTGNHLRVPLPLWDPVLIRGLAGGPEVAAVKERARKRSDGKSQQE